MYLIKLLFKKTECIKTIKQIKLHTFEKLYELQSLCFNIWKGLNYDLKATLALWI